LVAGPLGFRRARKGSPIDLIGAWKDSMSYTNFDSFRDMTKDPTNIIFPWSRDHVMTSLTRLVISRVVIGS
jgi:hypothetical protein